MLRRESLSAGIALLGLCLVVPGFAQQPGGSVGMPGATAPPGGVEATDALKDFHDAMAVQASKEQRTAFEVLLKSTQAAKGELQIFLHQGDRKTLTSEQLEQSLENARTMNRKFLDGFSVKQKDLLKDPIRRVEKADSGVLEKQKRLGAALHAGSNASNEISALLDALDKSFVDFAAEQVALGREMGISLASGQDVAFALPPVKSTVQVREKAVEVAISGDLSQTSGGAERTFRVNLAEDLSDLQHSATEVLRTQFRDNGGCGERLAVRQAAIVPAIPASILTLQLHYERWACLRLAEQTSPNEIAEGDGSVQLKLLPVLDSSGTMRLKTDFLRVEAPRMMRESIQSGNLGDDLREKVVEALLPVISALADFRTLPPALQQSIKLRNVEFRDAGAAILGLALEGEVQLSGEQADALASQLNQTLSAKDAGSR